MTVAEIQARNERIRGARKLVHEKLGEMCADYVKQQKSKYHNQKTEIDGILFDSKKEAARWLELKLLEKAGAIVALERQRPYVLYVISEDLGMRVDVGKFTPDFEYWIPAVAGTEQTQAHEAMHVIEDVKSPITRKETAYRLRKRIFEALYGLTLTEI